MLILQAILIAEIFVSVNCQCIRTSFWVDLVNEKKPSCRQEHFYIRGFNIDFDGPQSEHSMFLDGADCCSPPHKWRAYGALVVYANWGNPFNDEKFLRCPKGFFLNGLYRDVMIFYKYEWEFWHMTRPRCAKPAGHPGYYSNCYTQKTADGFSRMKSSSCKEGYYVTGIYKSLGFGGANRLHSMQCCSMAPKHQDIQNIEDVKTIIMERTLVSITQLAQGLGYKYCMGVNGIHCGEDFVRIDDKWETSAELFSQTDICLDEHCVEGRLEIVYNDWNLIEKGVTYGDKLTYNYQPETIDSGTVANHGSTNVSESFEITKNVTDSISIDKESSVTNTNGKPLNLNFKLNNLPGVSGSYGGPLKTSEMTKNGTQLLDSRIYTQSNQINLPPFSNASYNVTVIQKRTTIPYTADIIGTFSVLLRGFLKWDFPDGRSINYHHHYQKEKRDITFDYRFGDKHVPFYKALRKERDTQASPWLWKEMLIHHPNTSFVIDNLIYERSYEFKIKGTLEMISGVEIEVVWI